MVVVVLTTHVCACVCVSLVVGGLGADRATLTANTELSIMSMWVKIVSMYVVLCRDLEGGGGGRGGGGGALTSCFECDCVCVSGHQVAVCHPLHVDPHGACRLRQSQL